MIALASTLKLLFFVPGSILIPTYAAIYTYCPLFIRPGNVTVPVIDTIVYESFLRQNYENKISFSHAKVEGGESRPIW